MHSPVLATRYKTFSFQTKNEQNSFSSRSYCVTDETKQTTLHSKVEKLLSFEKDRNLKDHTRNVHVKKIKCDF